MLRQHHQLLVVLLAEQRDVGLHDVQQLQHHGGDAAEVAGTELALEDGDLGRRRIDVIALRLRVHLRLVRREQVGNTGGLELLAVGRERARVAVEVLAGAELQPIDEDAGDHAIGLLAGLAHQRDMALVQVTHGGDEGDLAGAGAGGAQAFDGVMDLHAETVVRVVTVARDGQ